MKQSAPLKTTDGTAGRVYTHNKSDIGQAMGFLSSAIRKPIPGYFGSRAVDCDLCAVSECPARC
jgi:hypothetical protein